MNYIARKEVTGTATYPTQSYDKCYMYICYNYDSDSISLICGTTVSGRGPQPPDNYIFSAEISSSSDCGDFEYHRLIKKMMTVMPKSCSEVMSYGKNNGKGI